MFDKYASQSYHRAEFTSGYGSYDPFHKGGIYDNRHE